MAFQSVVLLRKLAFLAMAALPVSFWPAPVLAQGPAEVYTATVIASEGVAGTTGRMSIRIAGYTPEADKARLRQAFRGDAKSGMALLRTMSQGYINIEGMPGRKIEAVFARDRADGRELVIVGEHMASKLEQWQGTKAEDYPVAVIHLRLDPDGVPIAGEIFPAVKLAVTPEGFIDVQTGTTNKITMVDLARQ